MKINIFYLYTIYGCKRANSLPNIYPVIDVVCADIEEISSDKAPVFCSWHEDSHEYQDYKDETDTIQVRSYEGNFYVPLKLNPTETYLSEFIYSESELDRNLQEIHQKHLSKFKKEDNKNSMLADKNYAAPKLAEVISSDKEIFSKRISRTAKEFVLIDGKIWKQCPEPCLVMEEDHAHGINIYLYTGFPETEKNNSRLRKFYFALNNIDDLMICVDLRRGELNLKQAAVNYINNNVYMSELISIHHVADEIVRNAKLYLNNFGDAELRKASNEQIRTWLNMRECMEAAELTPDNTNIELLMDAWEQSSKVVMKEKLATYNPASDVNRNLLLKYNVYNMLRNRLDNVPISVERYNASTISL